MKYKEGDRVIAVKKGSVFFEKGAIGTIYSITKSLEGYWVQFENNSSGDMRWFVNEHQIEPYPQEIEEGDTVRLRDDLTLKELNDSDWFGAKEDILWALEYKETLKVDGVYSDRFIEENKYVLVSDGTRRLPLDYVNLVEKAPKKLYFDGRLCSSNAPLSVPWVHENHGKTKEELKGSKCLFADDWFVEEEPEPIRIVRGEFK